MRTTVRPLYPDAAPHDQGFLQVGPDDQIYWEVCGNPRGIPAVVLHGGPGSGCTPWNRRLFDPSRYRIVLLDQRNCGRSTPNAADPATDLSENTTTNLIEDIERLRQHLEIEQWLVLGGSWGSTLALAYAEAHPARVLAMVLFGCTTGRRSELDWLFRDGLERFFPAEWQQRRGAVPAAYTGLDIVEAYSRLLNDDDTDIRQSAANAWCLWESATPDWPPSPALAPRFRDPAFALAFARIVTHYVKHDLWLEDNVLLRDAGKLGGIPGTVIQGRFDFQAPLGNAWALKQAWPQIELIVVDNAGHVAGSAGISSAIIETTDRYAAAMVDAAGPRKIAP
jgi:proline iminopeptidase